MIPKVHMCESCLKRGKFVAVDPARVKAGFTTCLPCGGRIADQRRHTIVPLHKSNYIVPANDDEVKGINNKGGFYR
jgi:hypothetical protein